MNVLYIIMEKYSLECFFIILFLLMCGYFCGKFDAFLCEHVHVFKLNTV